MSFGDAKGAADAAPFRHTISCSFRPCAALDRYGCGDGPHPFRPGTLAASGRSHRSHDSPRPTTGCRASRVKTGSTRLRERNATTVRIRPYAFGAKSATDAHPRPDCPSCADKAPRCSCGDVVRCLDDRSEPLLLLRCCYASLAARQSCDVLHETPCSPSCYQDWTEFPVCLS